MLSIAEYDYALPDERVAKYPLAERDKSKLLIYKDKNIEEDTFFNIANFLPANSLLVCNNTHVIQARLIFEKTTGAKIEIFCLEPAQPADYAQSFGATSICVWKCMVGNFKKWKNEQKLEKMLVCGEKNCLFSAEIVETEGNMHKICFSWNDPQICFADILEVAGELPIPPYLHRKTEKSDLTAYQTVYSKIKGSVAAPTAGLHFTEKVFQTLSAKNIGTEEVTLHVGAGTFQPVKTEDANQHPMHAETFVIKRETIKKIMQNLGKIVAVGTTSVRTLESLYYLGCSLAQVYNSCDLLQVSQFEPYEKNFDISAKDALQNLLQYIDNQKLDALYASTKIMIKPGYKFRIVDAMITNFHQPRSTLLLLVSAFVGNDWQKIYNYALARNFRFLSYGDSSLLFKNKFL